MENQVKEQYKNNFSEYLLCLALDIGEGILRNGGEISRVEDTIERICRAYGAVHVEVFTIISFIDAAIRMPDGSYSYQLRRVKETATNLDMLESLNALSRRICREKPTLDEIDRLIHDVKRKKIYPSWMPIVAGAVTTGFFTLFFGSCFGDALIAAFVGSVISLINIFSPPKINGMAKTVISSFATAMIAGLSIKLGLGEDASKIIIGSIMLLVPGLSFGTALRDLLLGDLLSGMLKTLQACLCALMIAFGYMLAAVVLGGGVI